MISLGTPLSVSLNDFPPHFFLTENFNKKRETTPERRDLVSGSLWTVVSGVCRGAGLSSPRFRSR